jgi:carbon-monoxide dehydrogenase medium subunit
MKAAVFGYARAQSAEHAVDLFREAGDGAQYLAGGQSLVPTLNFRLGAPGTLIDLTRIEALKGVSDTGGTIRIGALTTHAAITRNALVQQFLPLVAEAYGHVAHPAVRNRGTLGGSIALGDPASEMPACMLALNATVHVLGLDGPRTIAIDDFYFGLYDNALAEGDLVVAIEIPKPAASSRHGFAELARRHGDYAMAGVAIQASGSQARIALFGVSDRAVRATAAEEAFARGAAAEECANLACEGIDVFGDLNASEATKRHLTGVMLKRALAAMNEGAAA